MAAMSIFFIVIIASNARFASRPPAASVKDKLRDMGELSLSPVGIS